MDISLQIQVINQKIWRINGICIRKEQRLFFAFLYSARNDFDMEKLARMDSIELSRHLKKILGEKMITEVYNEIAEERKLAQIKGKLKVDPRKGTLSAAGSIIVPASHHYGR